MPWKPSTDFEEEVLNLQPDHDFIFGALSEPEPQPFYPRPQSHIEYAATKRRQLKKQQEQYEVTGRFNDRLHLISQVQRIAGTKPLGEQATVNDWDTDKTTEKEVVAMMRHFGLGPSVEERLDEKVTMATFPVKKSVEVVQNGRKKVPLFFDDNLFKLKPRISNSSSGFESESNNNSLNNGSNDTDASLNISSSSSGTNSNSYHTTASGYNMNESNASSGSGYNVSLTNYKKAQEDRHTLLLQTERMLQYNKLHEEEEEKTDLENSFDAHTSLSSFSLETSTYDQDSFKTALNEYNTSEMRRSSDLNANAEEFLPSPTNQYSNIFICSHSSFEEDSNSYSKPSSSLLQRFLTPTEKLNESCTSTGTLASTSSSSSPIIRAAVPPTYANIAGKCLPQQNVNGLSKSSLIQPPHLHFYTPREVYEKKRRALQ